jgi:hypothetical protein
VRNVTRNGVLVGFFITCESIVPGPDNALRRDYFQTKAWDPLPMASYKSDDRVVSGSKAAHMFVLNPFGKVQPADFDPVAQAHFVAVVQDSAARKDALAQIYKPRRALYEAHVGPSQGGDIQGGLTLRSSTF